MSGFRVIKMYLLRIIVLKNGFTKIRNRLVQSIAGNYYTWTFFIQFENNLNY